MCCIDRKLINNCYKVLFVAFRPFLEWTEILFENFFNFESVWKVLETPNFNLIEFYLVILFVLMLSILQKGNSGHKVSFIQHGNYVVVWSMNFEFRSNFIQTEIAYTKANMIFSHVNIIAVLEINKKYINFFYP